ncbi:MAG: FecR domain-containing protein [Bacteroidales bacterium]
MTNDDKIKKWLAGELSDSERQEFESSADFAATKRLLEAVENFKAPEYDIEGEYSRLTKRVLSSKKTISLHERIAPLFKVAAVVILGLAIGYFFFNYFETFSNSRNWISEQTELYLPDSSFVSLNADSRIRYSGKKWKRERNVELQGEAFFRVNEGAQFRVHTEQGSVTVLGTEFTVKNWEDYYQVTCYSGLVKVTAQKKSVVLQPNTTFRIVQGKTETFSFSDQKEPDWLQEESSFRSVPIKFVINELKRQYKVSVETSDVDVEQLFTGSFSHEDLETALKTITFPANLTYEMNENKIVITVEGK